MIRYDLYTGRKLTPLTAWYVDPNKGQRLKLRKDHHPRELVSV